MLIDYNYKIDAKGITFDTATYEYTAKGNKGFIIVLDPNVNVSNIDLGDGSAYLSELVFSTPDGGEVSLTVDFFTNYYNVTDVVDAQFVFAGNFSSSSFLRPFEVMRLGILGNNTNFMFPITFKKAVFSTDVGIPDTWYTPIQFFPLY